MDERTRAYLRGRFRDYYRRTEIPYPPMAERREWGYIPWSAGGTTMVRHQSLLDLGDLSGFLTRERPRHVYYSAGTYRSPGAGSMGEKTWLGSDLIFDLDADHLPSVTPAEDSYGEMLAACKEELLKLLEFLTEDFGFSDLTVVFSGSRGYHVHVRDSSVRELGREPRREIVEYIRGIDIEFSELVTTEAVGGLGRRTPAEHRTLDTTGGWSARVHSYLLAFIDDLLTCDDGTAMERLQLIDGIGPERARAALHAARTNYESIADGNIDVHPAFYHLTRQLFRRVIETQGAAIDEPVTVDTHRLIRLPGSLHGGTGLKVTTLSLEELPDFDPLTDPIPELYRGHSITIRGDGGPSVSLNGETFTVPEGVTSLPEYAAVFLMARGRAAKEKEP